ncbi:MAG: sugar kinase [Candidatus Hydrogenedentes bacterium]|nr:sugar kinase [Candidatus Hydrogenedentota bacterium]
MVDLVTFGEAMVRLAPPSFQRVEQTTNLEARVGGAELNVAVAASRLGLRTRWISRLTDNALGRMIANEARKHGVDVDSVLWTPEDRIGLYFVEFGAAPRPSSVLYDRAHSAISKIAPRMVDWKNVFAGVKHFHCSGITPALSDSAAEATAEALRTAKHAGCSVSYDLNYRGKLWSPEKARQVQEPMMEFVDILISTEEDTKKVFGIQGDKSVDDDSFASLSGQTYAIVAKKLADRFKFKVVAITLRESISVWRNTWSAIAYHDGKIHEGSRYEVEIVDRVGAGDSFSAGFIYGFLKQDVSYGLHFGTAYSALAHSIPGDFNYCSKEEVEGLMKGGGLRIKR